MKQKIQLINVVFLFLTLPLLGHGDLHEQIERLSTRIEKEPSNAQLYLKRGQLYAQHKDFKKAHQDYVFARKLDAQLLVVDLLIAKLFAAQEQPETGLKHINAFLEVQPNNPEALITRAGIFQQLGKTNLCQVDLETALTQLKEPTPSHFIHIAEAITLADTSNVSEALLWLEKGQERFAFDIVLQSKKVELYVQSKQFEAAIQTIDKILEHLPRKEKWLFEKARIYELAGYLELAKTHYEMALNTIQSLPSRLQMTRKMLELETAILEKILALSE